MGISAREIDGESVFDCDDDNPLIDPNAQEDPMKSTTIATTSLMTTRVRMPALVLRW